MALAQVNPGIIMSGQPFTPVTNYLQGVEFRQKADEAKQLQGLRALQMTNEQAQMQENLAMYPYRLQQAKQEAEARGLGIDTARAGLEIGQYGFEKEKKQDLRAQNVENVIGKFVGETGKLPYNDPVMQKSFISEISKADPKIAIEYSKHFDEMARAKSQAEALAKQQDFENTIKWKKMLNDNARLDFDKLKLKFDMEAPYRNEAINQQFLNQELAGNLALKRNPNIRLTDNKIKAITAITAKTPEVLRLVNDLRVDVATHGTKKISTEAKKRMESNLGILQGILKSPEFINLGVLTGPDKEFLDAITGNPTTFWNFEGNILEKLRSTEISAVNNFNSIANSNGFTTFSKDEILGLNPGALSSIPNGKIGTTANSPPQKFEFANIKDAEKNASQFNDGDTVWIGGRPQIWRSK